MTTCKCASTFGGIALLRGYIFLNDGGRTSDLAMNESCRKELEDMWMKCVKIRDVRRIRRCAGTEKKVTETGEN